MYFKHILGLVLLILLSCIPLFASAQTYPEAILIRDLSFDSYRGKFEYEYELIFKEDHYQLFQNRLFETNFKREKERLARKFVKRIPLTLVEQLLFEIEHPRDSFGITDLGFSYEWFAENKQEVYRRAAAQWKRRWPDDPKWNAYQEEYIKSQITVPAHIAKAVRWRFLNENSIVLHSTDQALLELELIYPKGSAKRKTTLLVSNYNYLCLPWILDKERRVYNSGISSVVHGLLPANKGMNRTRLVPINREKILKSLIRQLYDSFCERGVKKLTWHNFEPQIASLQARYEISEIVEEGTYTGNWSGEQRLFMYARDTTESRNIPFALSLEVLGNKLYSPDSLLKKGDQLLERVNQIPFLLEYLDENPERSLEITFDNGYSMSTIVKEYQSGVNSWYEGACLTGADEDYLNACLAFVLRNEMGQGSNWLITPDLDVFLIYYQYPTVYRYSDDDFDTRRVSTRYVCQAFNLDGTFKE